MSSSNPQLPPAGIYIHWPFCARKCPYCDFFTFGREHPQFEASRRYLAALVGEIETACERLGLNAKPLADTIYFGGGTPSLMEPDEVEGVLQALRGQFEIAADAEITMEVNPTAAEAERLTEARRLGVNRLSVGCQSFDDKFLKILGRDHDAATARRVLGGLRESGFENISLDLMFGLPEQSFEEFDRDLEIALGFAPDHISAYGLTFHDGTPFKRWRDEKRWPLPGAEVEAAMFEHLMDRLAEAGFEHYELSNWSRPGRRSRHNSKYWRQCDVFAFGASAHGVLKGRRYANPRDLAAYMGAGAVRTRALALPEPTAESDRSKAGEVMMLALRRVDGVEWRELEEWMGFDPRAFYASEFERLEREGLVGLDLEKLTLSRRGILFADSVIERFF